MGRNKSRKEDVVHDRYYANMGRTARRQNSSITRQNLMEAMLERVLGELAMNRFKWSGLPDSVDTRFLEKTLYLNALCVMFEDKNTGKLLAVRGSAANGYDMNDNPLSFRLTDRPFNGVTLAARNCVPVWPNYFRMPDTDIVYVYASKIANFDRTIEINGDNARINKVAAFSENGRLTAENILRMVQQGDTVIPVNSNNAQPLSEMITALDLGIDPKHIETLSVVRQRLWSEAMGLLGINNANQDKKERLVEAEVGANDDQVESSRNVALNARKWAAKQITKKYPHLITADEVTVEYNNSIDGSMPEFLLGGLSDADIHDGIATGS